MEDIVPELLEKIQNSFVNNMMKDRRLAAIENTINSGKATYKDADEYAYCVGTALSKALLSNISEDGLPDGRMYYNIAQRILQTTFENNYDLITEKTSIIQSLLNEEAGIGIRAITPELNQERIDGIVNKISDADHFSDVKWLLDAPVVNFSQSVVDDSVRENADFHYRSGMRPKIVRTAEINCCDMCTELEGTYDYPVERRIYWRHRNCNCIVEYHPLNGKVQNAHTKEWRETEDVEELKNVGMEHEIRITKGQDVTEEYLQQRFIENGIVEYDDGYSIDNHQEEIKVAEWLRQTYGGTIRLLKESEIEGVKSPDYIWNGTFWELKSVTSEKAANSAVRTAIKQIYDNPGGIILNYDHEIDIQSTIDIIERRVHTSTNDISFDIMIVENGNTTKVIRY